MKNKTGDIHDPLSQTHSHASSKHCFLLFCFCRFEKSVQTYGRTDNMWENNDPLPAVTLGWQSGSITSEHYYCREKIKVQRGRNSIFETFFPGLRRFFDDVNWTDFAVGNTFMEELESDGLNDLSAKTSTTTTRRRRTAGK